ncbi:hypothetical protein OIU76_005407 [Salix suchowensis]|nr:hypothetical protein OIU76_005407 [Salix suchowensis]
MPIFTNISPDNRLAIIVVPAPSLQTERGIQIPGLLALTKRTIQISLAPVPIKHRSPDPRFLKILENPSEQHVVPLLFSVNTTGPVTNVQAIPSEPPR